MIDGNDVGDEESSKKSEKGNDIFVEIRQKECFALATKSKPDWQIRKVSVLSIPYIEWEIDPPIIGECILQKNSSVKPSKAD